MEAPPAATTRCATTRATSRVPAKTRGRSRSRWTTTTRRTKGWARAFHRAPLRNGHRGRRHGDHRDGRRAGGPDRAAGVLAGASCTGDFSSPANLGTTLICDPPVLPACADHGAVHLAGDQCKEWCQHKLQGRRLVGELLCQYRGPVERLRLERAVLRHERPAADPSMAAQCPGGDFRTGNPICYGPAPTDGTPFVNSDPQYHIRIAHFKHGLRAEGGLRVHTGTDGDRPRARASRDADRNGRHVRAGELRLLVHTARVPNRARLERVGARRHPRRAPVRVRPEVLDCDGAAGRSSTLASSSTTTSTAPR